MKRWKDAAKFLSKRIMEFMVDQGEGLLHLSRMW